MIRKKVDDVFYVELIFSRPDHNYFFIDINSCFFIDVHSNHHNASNYGIHMMYALLRVIFKEKI